MDGAWAHLSCALGREGWGGEAEDAGPPTGRQQEELGEHGHVLVVAAAAVRLVKHHHANRTGHRQNTNPWTKHVIEGKANVQRVFGSAVCTSFELL